MIIKKVICIDETSIYLNMNQSYGRSKSGRRAIKKTNQYPYKKYNLLCAIKYNKVVSWILYKKSGGIKSNDVLEFYQKFIENKYKKHVIVMDNASIHKAKTIKHAISESKNTLQYTVPYHPETNAIEEFFSQLKHYIKKEVPMSYDEIHTSITTIIIK